MSPFDSELRQCLEIVLGSAPPEPDNEPLVFFKQWLAERNLGLVPIANPRDFDWPGHWLARVRAPDGDHAIVMFGSPSGPLHDPTGVLASGGTIEEGMVLAIEPGAYWDGGGGLRVEDNFLITAGGVEKLSSYPDDFR